jgi:hypothetical protein
MVLIPLHHPLHPIQKRMLPCRIGAQHGLVCVDCEPVGLDVGLVAHIEPHGVAYGVEEGPGRGGEMENSGFFRGQDLASCV